MSTWKECAFCCWLVEYILRMYYEIKFVIVLLRGQQTFSEKGHIVNILGFVGEETKLRHLHKEENSTDFFIDEIKNIIIIVCCNTYLLLRKNRILFWGDNISQNWNSVSVLYHQNQLQMFICQCYVNRILCISFFKVFFTHR